MSRVLAVVDAWGFIEVQIRMAFEVEPLDVMRWFLKLRRFSIIFIDETVRGSVIHILKEYSVQGSKSNKCSIYVLAVRSRQCIRKKSTFLKKPTHVQEGMKLFLKRTDPFIVQAF